MDYQYATAVLLLFALVPALLYRFVLHPLFFSPLSAIPGPRLAALTSWYLDLRYVADTAIPHIHQLFKKHGPIVRVGPSEIVLNDAQHLTSVYGIRSGFPKPPTAALFANHGALNVFSSVHREEHRERRRRVGKVYNLGTLLNNTELAAYLWDRVEVFRGKIDAAHGGALDIYPLALRFALDNVSFTVYGRGLDVLRGRHPELNGYIQATAIASVSIIRFHDWIGALSFWPLSLLLPGYIKAAVSSTAAIESTNMQEVENAHRQKGDPERSTVASLCDHAGYRTSFQLVDIASECNDHIVAGSDTTGASITYMLYNLALPEHAEYQARLRAEVSDLESTAGIKDICQLPFLDQCLYETLRLYAPAPGSIQQRITPPGTATSISVEDRTYVLPPGTVVGILPYSMHRDVQIFGADVDIFKPERWQQSNDTVAQKMKEAWIPFGSGARVCIGKHLAIIEIKTLVASIIRDYSVELSSEASRAASEPLLAPVIRPRSEKCELVFKRVD